MTVKLNSKSVWIPKTRSVTNPNPSLGSVGVKPTHTITDTSNSGVSRKRKHGGRHGAQGDDAETDNDNCDAEDGEDCEELN
jgi:hypothetical protein